MTAFAHLQLHPRQLREAFTRITRHPRLVLPLQPQFEQPVGERLPVGVWDVMAEEDARLFVVQREQLFA